MKHFILIAFLFLFGAVACATDEVPDTEHSPVYTEASYAICGATACGGMEGEPYDDCMNFHCGSEGGGVGGPGGGGGGSGAGSCNMTPVQVGWHCQSWWGGLARIVRVFPDCYTYSYEYQYTGESCSCPDGSAECNVVAWPYSYP